MKKLTEEHYLLGLSKVSGLGAVRTRKLVEILGSAEEVWKLSEHELRDLKLPKGVADDLLHLRSSIDLEAEAEKLNERGISVVGITNSGYPPLLREIYDPPTILYMRGQLDLDRPTIGVVGTRAPTSYGVLVTRKLVDGLTASGVIVVSGLARGVDGLAHRATLEAGGKTIAILGSGLGSIYPAENRKLAEEVVKSGAVVSEYPPEYEPSKGSFPARNRIISGLSVGILITEAGEDSGSLITARAALEQNRSVYVVPGPINSRQSVGANNLIKMGAKVVTDVSDILEDLEIKDVVSYAEIKGDNPAEEAILAHMNGEPVHFDELVRETRLPSGEVGACLTVMVISGKVIELGGSYYGKRH